MFLISSKSNALKFHHFGSRATTYDPGRATNIQSIIYMGNRKVFFFSVDNQFLTLENCSIIPTDVHRKEVIYASLLISMQFHRIILASGLLNTSWASIAMATPAPESCHSVPTDGNKQWRLYLLTFPAKSWEDSCLKPCFFYYYIGHLLDYLPSREAKSLLGKLPARSMGNHSSHVWTGIQVSPSGQEHSFDPGLAKQHLFPGNVELWLRAS